MAEAKNEFIQCVEAMIEARQKRDPWFGKREKARFPVIRYNRWGRLWEVWWHYEPWYAVWWTRWLAVYRGCVSGRIRGFQIWWPPVSFKLLWKRKEAEMETNGNEQKPIETNRNR